MVSNDGDDEKICEEENKVEEVLAAMNLLVEYSRKHGPCQDDDSQFLT